MEYQGKNVRLEVALDITKQELVGEQARERLALRTGWWIWTRCRASRTTTGRWIRFWLRWVISINRIAPTCFGRLWFIRALGQYL